MLSAGALLTDHDKVSLTADRELLFIEGQLNLGYPIADLDAGTACFFTVLKAFCSSSGLPCIRVRAQP